MVLIVAEIGVNFTSLSTAKQMIECAKWSGADAVKFQVFNEHIADKSSLRDELRKRILSYNTLKKLKDCADVAGVTFFATPMFKDAVNWLEELDVELYKVRYADRYNHGLIGKVLDTGKPTYVSTTHSSDFAYNTFDTHIKPIYCVPKYPPKLSEIHLTRYSMGYSNHYPGITPPLVAVATAALKKDFYLEVHVKMDHDHPIDDAVSVPFSEFKRMCDYIRVIEQLGEQ